METPATRWLQPYNIVSWSIGLWPGATLTCLSVSLYSGNYVGQTTGHYIIKRNFSLEIIPPVTRLQWTQSDLKVKHANVKEQNFTHHWNFVALFRSANLWEPTINSAGLSDSSKCDCDRVCEVWRETVGYFSDYQSAGEMESSHILNTVNLPQDLFPRGFIQVLSNLNSSSEFVMFPPIVTVGLHSKYLVSAD